MQRYDHGLYELMKIMDNEIFGAVMTRADLERCAPWLELVLVSYQQLKTIFINANYSPVLIS